MIPSQKRTYSSQDSTPPSPRSLKSSERQDYLRDFHVDTYGIRESKCPPDAPGEEMSPRARIWNVYLEEIDKLDDGLLSNWNHSLDVLLVFAGLFSAVVTTFVVQSSQDLQPDYAQITALLLSELIRSQGIRSDKVSVLINSTDSVLSPSIMPSTRTRWVNGLWFTSLVLSLSLALLAVLVKQWLQSYVSDISGSPQERARLRFFRHSGLLKWHVPGIVDSLPVLMHVALFLFFMGLVQFIASLDPVISAIVTALVAVTYIVYMLSIFFPLFHPQCPYRTPLSQDVLRIFCRMRQIIREAQYHMALLTKAMRLPWLSDLYSSKSTDSFGSETVPSSLKKTELSYISKAGDPLDASIITWLATATVDPDIRSIALQALAGLNPKFQAYEVLYRSGIFPLIEQAFHASIPSLDRLHMVDPFDVMQAERYGRALYHFSCWLGPRARMQSRENMRSFLLLPKLDVFPDIKILGTCATMRFIDFGQSTTRNGLKVLSLVIEGKLPSVSTNAIILLLNSVADSMVSWGLPTERSFKVDAYGVLLKLLDFSALSLRNELGQAFARAFHTFTILQNRKPDINLHSIMNALQDRPAEDAAYSMILQSLLVALDEGNNPFEEHIPLTTLHLTKFILMGLTEYDSDTDSIHYYHATVAISELVNFVSSKWFSLKYVPEGTASDMLEVFLRSPQDTPRSDTQFLRNLIIIIHSASDERTHMRALLLIQRCANCCSLDICKVFRNENILLPIQRHINVSLLASTAKRIVCAIISSIALQASNCDIEDEVDYLIEQHAVDIIHKRAPNQRLSLYEYNTVWLPSLLDLCRLRPSYPLWSDTMAILLKDIGNMIEQEERQLLSPDQRFLDLAKSVISKVDDMKDLLGISHRDATFTIGYFQSKEGEAHK